MQHWGLEMNETKPSTVSPRLGAQSGSITSLAGPSGERDAPRKTSGQQLRRLPFRIRIRRLINNEYERIDWVSDRLRQLPPKTRLLDAGCGSQQYRKFCQHLHYESQDFGQYSVDEADSLTASQTPYEYGRIDYVSNIWEIPVPAESFDAVLCTEVFEHIPHPTETIAEFSRILRPGGQLLLTVPSNCLRHMDPYFFFSGFSDRYLRHFLEKYGFQVTEMTVVGDYNRWMLAEVARTAALSGWWAKIAMLPAFFYYYLKQRQPTEASRNTLCMGYMIRATKK